MLKTEKLSTEEQLTNQLKNFTIEEAESYLELLLSKSIEAIKKDDLQTYSAIEKTLTESILIFSSRIKNFNLLFTKIKLRVARTYLKTLLNVNSISVLEDVDLKTDFLTFEEAKILQKSKEFKLYERAKNNVDRNYYPSRIIENKKYLIDVGKGSLIDKETGFEMSISVEQNEEVINAFITKKSELLDNDKLMEVPTTVEEIAKEEKRIERIDKKTQNEFDYSSYWESVEATSYFNEDPIFVVYINEYNQIIIKHKKTGAEGLIEFFSYEEWFVIQFLNYCIGKEGIQIQRLKDYVED